MKAYFENIPSDKGNSSVYAYRLQVPFFEFKWHYHPEFELTYIIKGSGYRLVGNTLNDFNAGDFVLLGSNVPHTWCSKEQDETEVEAIVIQFLSAPLTALLALEESQSLSHLMAQATKGIQFSSTVQWKAMLKVLTESEGLDRLVQLIALLNQLATTNYHLICPNNHYNIVSRKQELRINTVCQYISEHYQEYLPLKKVADLVYMSESNFCKFFKKATGKTYSDYLNEMRIQSACLLLRDSDLKINIIAHDCGFETLSYFNRVFLKKKKCTPKAFRIKWKSN
jgi:AraC-like DNA-binding protein